MIFLHWRRELLEVGLEALGVLGVLLEVLLEKSATLYSMNSCLASILKMILRSSFKSMLPSGSAYVFSLSELSVATFISVSKSNAI